MSRTTRTRYGERRSTPGASPSLRLSVRLASRFYRLASAVGHLLESAGRRAHSLSLFRGGDLLKYPLPRRARIHPVLATRTSGIVLAALLHKITPRLEALGLTRRLRRSQSMLTKQLRVLRNYPERAMPFGIALLLTVAVVASLLPGAPADARLALISVDGESDVASTDSATTNGTWGSGQDIDTGAVDMVSPLVDATSLDGELLIGEVPLGASASWRAIEPRMLMSESDTSLSAAGDFGVVIQADGRFMLPAAIDPIVHDGRSHLIVHVVRRGESLQAIAQKYHVSLMELVWSNGLTNIDRPAGGRRLRVPDTHGVVHIVKEHETLKSIAARVGVSVKRLMDYNDLRSANVVIGMVLIAPGGHGASLPTYQTPWNGVYAYSGSLPKVYSGTTFRYPVPGGSYVRGFTRTHQGMDIAAPIGRPILAAAAGVVVRAGWMSGGCANTVFIAHGSNLYTGYCHQSRILVSVGQRVARGQIIGLVGSTGNSTGPHCHFLVSRGSPFSYNSVLYDPSRFLP